MAADGAAQTILKNVGWRFCSMAKIVFGLNQPALEENGV
jgi:hypothetical protein